MKTSALYSQYVIDGAVMEQTPAQILDAVSYDTYPEPCSRFESIVDESMDPVLSSSQLDPALLEDYLSAVMASSPGCDPAYSDVYTRLKLASALCSVLWRDGHFKLENLALSVLWNWTTDPVGAASAFYSSVLAVSDYIDALDLKLASYSVHENEYALAADVEVSLSGDTDAEEDVFLLEGRMCPDTLLPDPQSWLVYIPFDTCDFRLGGSMLARSLNLGLGVAPQISDADYFIDCYEVLRELVEDGVVIAGTEVGEGGMLKAVKTMMMSSVGIDIDISDVMNSYEETDVLRILFSEVPGVIIQIKDSDFDYLDAELLLQDVAFFPLGHPAPGTDGLHVHSSRKNGIQRILESLMQNAEGED